MGEKGIGRKGRDRINKEIRKYERMMRRIEEREGVKKVRKER